MRKHQSSGISKPPCHLWQWEHDGPKTRAKLELVISGETIKEYPWSAWVKFPTSIDFGYWDKK